MNKNEEKVQRAEAARNREIAGDTLDARFPSIKDLKLHLQFFGAHNEVLEDSVQTMVPGKSLRSRMDCPGRCGKGCFDFSEVIEQAAKSRQSLSENSVSCPEPLHPGSREVCGCHVEYRLEVEYHPLPEQSPPTPSEPAGLSGQTEHSAKSRNPVK
ncbi:MAG: hypothetical protein NTY77_06975 [Elusimicrobia bacterium]|nr:hypothetical protein [Elusimicrobiota bacterium]